MYSTFVTLKDVSAVGLAEIAFDHGVIFSHYDTFDSPVKLLMADDEQPMLDVINEVLEDKQSPFSVEGLPEDTPFRITL